MDSERSPKPKSWLGRMLNSFSKKDVTEEEIIDLVEIKNTNNENSESQIIANVFDWNDTAVTDVMTHRTDIVAVSGDMPITEVVKIAIDEGYSRIPVYEGGIDNIIGVIYVKDLLKLIGCEDKTGYSIADFLHKPVYVSSTQKCNKVFDEMQKSKVHLAFISGEQGGIEGLVTMEDLLEDLVGNIQDEYDNEDEEITQEGNIFIIDGAADPEEILNRFDVPLPDKVYSTMSAMFIDILGRIPNNGEIVSVNYKNLVFTAEVTEDNWINKLKAETKNTEEIENENSF